MVAQIALLSDLHANAPALRAVLDDLDRREAARAFNAVYCLGDLGGYAGEPNEVQELIMALGCPVVLGNYDEGVGFDREDCGCRYTRPFEIAMSDISFRWTREHTTTEHKAWLRTLPREIRLEIGGYRVLLCHGSPRDTTEYLFENRSDGYLRQFTAGGRADAHAEARLGVGLPPTYRAFLMVSNGWRQAGPYLGRLWSAAEIGWYGLRHGEVIAAYLAGVAAAGGAPAGGGAAAPDAGPRYATALWPALEISDPDAGSDAVMLLVPDQKAPGGGWAASFFMSWSADIAAFRNRCWRATGAFARCEVPRCRSPRFGAKDGPRSVCRSGSPVERLQPMDNSCRSAAH